MNEELRQAFLRFKNALTNAWCLNTEDACTDRDRASTKRAHELAHQREEEFLALLESQNAPKL